MAPSATNKGFDFAFDFAFDYSESFQADTSSRYV